jgi:hypothetical protein
MSILLHKKLYIDRGPDCLHVEGTIRSIGKDEELVFEPVVCRLRDSFIVSTRWRPEKFHGDGPTTNRGISSSRELVN